MDLELLQLSFLFREDPDYWSFDDVSLTAAASQTNLIANPGFENGAVATTNGTSQPNSWSLIGSPGLIAAGVLTEGGQHSGSWSWYDGALNGFDGPAQTVATVTGTTYTLKFWLESSGSSNNGVLSGIQAPTTSPDTTSSEVTQFLVYEGTLPGGLTVTPPSAPPGAPTVTHIDGSATITTDANDRPVITGLASAATPSGSTITVYAGGVEIGTTTTTDSGGDWSFTPTTALADGSHSITATETVGSTGTSSQSSGYSVSIVTPPTVTGADGLANHTDDNSKPVITGTAAASSPTGTTITVYVDGTAVGTTTTSDIAGDWSYTPSAALSVGSHTIAATETIGSVASNMASSYALTIYAPPVITGISAGSFGGPSVADAAETATADALPLITGTSQANASITIYDGGTWLGTTTANASGAWSFTPSAVLSVATHSLTAKETISSYVSPASSAYSLTIDTPSIYLIAQPSSVGGTYTVTYDVSGSAVAVDTIATVTEDSAATVYTENSNFVGGSLTVSSTNPTGSDALDVARAASIATTAGAISVNSAGGVYLGSGSGATPIGAVTGAGTNALAINFTSSLVTDAAVQVLTRVIVYSDAIGSSGTAPGSADALTVKVTTGYGNSSSQTVDVAFTNSHGANNASTLALNTTGVSATVATNGLTSAAVVDAALTLTGSGTLTQASVIIQNFETGDSLGFTNGSGLTGSYNASSGVLTVSGSGSAASYQTFLRDVTFYTTSTNTTARSISFATGGALYDATNSHFYEFVSSSNISWYSAEVGASQLTFDGMQGYLATVTSSAESAFIIQTLDGQGWMGASDVSPSPTASSVGTYSLTVGHWHWVNGPESLVVGADGLPGIYFFQQTGGSSSSVWASYWASRTSGGAAVGSNFTNWSSGQPDDSVNEYNGQLNANGSWSDLSPTQTGINGYVVEFGGMPTDPALSVTGTATIDVVNSVTVSAPALAAASDTGQSSSDGITKDTTQVFTGTATGGATVTLYNASTVEGSGTANASGAWSITSSLAAGSYSITAKSSEFGLTSSASAADVVVVDTTPPTVAITAVGPATAGDTTDVTANTTPVISGTVSDNLAGTPSVEVYIDGVAVGAASVTSGTWTFTSPALGHGVHEVAVTATDLAGNTSALSADTAVTVDAPPTIGTSATVSSQGVTKTTTMAVTEDSNGSLTLYANDTDGDALAWRVSTQGAHGVAVVSSAGVVTYSPTPGQTVSDSFQVSVTDGLGGTATETVTVSVTAVNHAPVLTPALPAVNLGTTSESVTNALSTGTQFSDRSIAAGETITDSDTSAAATIGKNIQSIAVTSVDNTNGEWFYSTNNGGTWTPFTTNTGGVESILSTAVLLNGANGGPALNYVKFVPNLNFVGTAGISFVAWDVSSNQQTAFNGGTFSTVNLSGAAATGGNTDFSSATAIAYTTVTTVDAAPVLATSAVAPVFVDEAPSAGYYGSGAVAVDPLLTLTNPADVNTTHDNIAKVTVGVEAGSSVVGTDVLSVNTAVPGGPSNLGESYSSGTGVLTLTGSGTAAQWQTLLRTLTYEDTATTDTGASTAARTVTYTIAKGGAAGTTNFSSDTITKTVSIASITATDALAGIPYTAVPNTFTLESMDQHPQSGMTLVVQADGGVVLGDSFAFADNGSDPRGAVTTDGNNGTALGANGYVWVGGNEIATYTEGSGVLTITFNANPNGSVMPSQDQVNAILNQIVYTTASATAVTATLTDDDGHLEALLAAVTTTGSQVTPFPATVWSALPGYDTFDLSQLDLAQSNGGALIFTLEEASGPDSSASYFIADSSDPRGGAFSNSASGNSFLDSNGNGISSETARSRPIQSTTVF